MQWTVLYQMEERSAQDPGRLNRDLELKSWQAPEAGQPRRAAGLAAGG